MAHSPEQLPDHASERIVTVAHPQGLHLRTGKEIVRLASCFSAEMRAINLSRTSPEVNLKSILQLMQLQAQCGHSLRLHAVGSDAEVALAAVAKMIECAEPAVEHSSTETPES